MVFWYLKKKNMILIKRMKIREILNNFFNDYFTFLND